jgi:hypothetical protein
LPVVGGLFKIAIGDYESGLGLVEAFLAQYATRSLVYPKLVYIGSAAVITVPRSKNSTADSHGQADLGFVRLGLELLVKRIVEDLLSFA